MLSGIHDAERYQFAFVFEELYLSIDGDEGLSEYKDHVENRRNFRD